MMDETSDVLDEIWSDELGRQIEEMALINQRRTQPSMVFCCWSDNTPDICGVARSTVDSFDAPLGMRAMGPEYTRACLEAIDCYDRGSEYVLGVVLVRKDKATMRVSVTGSVYRMKYP